MSKLSFISWTVFLNVNSLAHLTLLIWGCLGQQIIQPCSPDDTDKYFPRLCPQIKITPACSQVCREERAGSWRYQPCLAPPSPRAGPWRLWWGCRWRKCYPGDMRCSDCMRGMGRAWRGVPSWAIALPTTEGKPPRRMQRVLRELGQSPGLAESHLENGFTQHALPPVTEIVRSKCLNAVPQGGGELQA